MPANTATTSHAAATPRRELAGRALMWLAVLGAAGAAGTALLTVLDADGATKVVETWRMYGLVVFTGLFVLLMLRPHHYRGVWELVIATARNDFHRGRLRCPRRHRRRRDHHRLGRRPRRGPHRGLHLLPRLDPPSRLRGAEASAWHDNRRDDPATAGSR